MSTPEVIYLIPGEDIEGYPGMVWCDDPAPSYADDPEEAVKYVRADTLPQPVLPPFPPEGEGMPRYGLQWNGPESPVTVLMDDGYWTPWHRADAEVEHLQDALIRQGKMLSAIVNITKGPPEGSTLHSTHDAVESVERLQAEFAERVIR